MTHKQKILFDNLKSFNRDDVIILRGSDKTIAEQLQKQKLITINASTGRIMSMKRGSFGLE